MAIWKVEVSIYGQETVSAETRTLREACDMVFMCRAAMKWEPQNARKDASSIERTFNWDRRNTKRAGVNRVGCYSITVEKVG